MSRLSRGIDFITVTGLEDLIDQSSFYVYDITCNNADECIIFVKGRVSEKNIFKLTLHVYRVPKI